MITGTVALAGIIAFGAYYLRKTNHPRAVAASVRPQISAIAVLPLENLSNDPNQEYFVEGMTDEIITDLAQLPGLEQLFWNVWRERRDSDS